ncbi:RNA polymerase sigma factor SigW [Virgibacillus sp. NKC19-3]|uniref:RNA polymerase sigma factor SigW n=1 Tax=Virgibacillus saliphilus TaxID=2831674 RepID=UPI001C9AAD9D|nr:RNA polymerase sigma factor SigW [Virgibacillus sp. NKC19-3]MBY7141845.1 RNA polymerase sigma factor SigW [Virgibacillus sp. NKC19-3]
MEQVIRDKIRQVKKGDQSAFEDVIAFYQDKIYRHCFRMIGNAHEAEDIAQEAFIRAYINIHSFDDRRKFSTWLYRIATNVTIDHIRKRKPDYFLDDKIKGTEGLDMYSRLISNTPSPGEEAESRELQRYIHQEITRLPPKYRSIIILRYIEEFSLQEISNTMDIPLGTVKTRIHRAREALRKKLRYV